MKDRVCLNATIKSTGQVNRKFGAWFYIHIAVIFIAPFVFSWSLGAVLVINSLIWAAMLYKLRGYTPPPTEAITPSEYVLNPDKMIDEKVASGSSRRTIHGNVDSVGVGLSLSVYKD